MEQESHKLSLYVLFTSSKGLLTNELVASGTPFPVVARGLFLVLIGLG